MSDGRSRFRARPLALVADELADALGWPRSRPARLLAGERASAVGRLVLCADEGALVASDTPPDAAALLAAPAEGGSIRAGRRAHDPFVGADDDVASWRRAQRVVLDAALLLVGGRGGIDEQLAARLGLVALAGHAGLLPVRSVTRDVAKLVGYVPPDALEVVRDAVFDAGAGTIGAYDRCSWAVLGTGTFRGGEGTSPAVGARGEFERVEEVRLEIVVPVHLVQRACRAFVGAHPYEAPAFDVVRLELPAEVGFGRIGRIGAGGGPAAWAAASAIDPEAAAYGRVHEVASGATCAVHAGRATDVLDQLLAQEDLGLAVVASASDAELDALAGEGTAVLVLDRTRAFELGAPSLAVSLTRALTLPVTVAGALHFPDAPASAQPGAGATSGPTPIAEVFTAPASAPADGIWRLHFDGGSRGNPGPAAYGWVLYGPGGDEVESDGVRIGSTTNNVAEWTGLLRGLEHAAERGIRHLHVRGNSELVVKQVTRVYKVRNAALKPLAEQVWDVIRRFDRVDVEHVYRTENARADAVANEAMDGLR